MALLARSFTLYNVFRLAGQGGDILRFFENLKRVRFEYIFVRLLM